jgi:hypothetical protein
MANERHLVAKPVPLPAMHMIHVDAFQEIRSDVTNKRKHNGVSKM